jgi:hypothetical protein
VPDFSCSSCRFDTRIPSRSSPSGNPVGALIKVTPGSGEREELFPGALIAPGGMTIGRDGSIYVTRFATLPYVGDVVRIQP